uniref:Putative secreted protein n=1 Tax=Anopheles darlingi TaxID=43151 RepID=A0A2M4DQ32_ANODA
MIVSRSRFCSSFVCFIAISPIFGENLRMFSRNSRKSSSEDFLMFSFSRGMVSRICCENRYPATFGRYSFSSTSRVFSAG